LTRLLGFRPLLAVSLLVIPVLVLLLFVAIDASIPIIILLYSIIVIDGAGLAYWILSSLGNDGDSSTLPERSSGQLDAEGHYHFYPSRNRAETLAVSVKSASNRRPSHFRQYSREEIARVMKHILEDTAPRGFNYFPLGVGEPANDNGKLIPKPENRLSLELEFLLHHQHERAKKAKSGKETIFEEEKPKPASSEQRLDYLSSLEHVLSEIESSR
jgi:hypothetical protein